MKLREGIILTDRSAIETDWDCGMRYYWNRVHNGQGIVPRERAPWFGQGSDLHGDLEFVAKWEDRYRLIDRGDEVRLLTNGGSDDERNEPSGGEHVRSDVREGGPTDIIGDNLSRGSLQAGVDPAQAVEQGVSSEHSELGQETQARGSQEHLLELLEEMAGIGQLRSSGADYPTIEIATRRLGFSTAFALYVEPLWKNQGWEDISVESELVLQRDPLWIGVIPDRVQRNRETKRIRYVEYKSTFSLGYGFQNYWPTAVQLHAGIKALEEEIRERVDYAQVVGFYKGREYRGRLTHPYVWAYSKGGEWQADYKYGWEPTPVWEYPGGVVEWVKRLGEEGFGEAIGFSAPVYLDERLLANFIQSTTKRFGDIEAFSYQAQHNEVIRNEMFQQRFSKCRPMVGAPCEYLGACFNATIHDDPLASGLYVKRDPHHDLEKVGIDYGD